MLREVGGVRGWGGGPGSAAMGGSSDGNVPVPGQGLKGIGLCRRGGCKLIGLAPRPIEALSGGRPAVVEAHKQPALSMLG